MIKMRVVAPLVLAVWNQAHNPMSASDPNRAWSLLLGFYTYPVQLYLNFSGYTDVAIGSATLLGFRLPENFNRPYLARNVLDFWNRWHMSLTHWIRDYIFMASYKAAATNYPRWARSWSYGLIFVALFVTGIWHGTTSGFAVFGILNGIGAAVNRAYADVLKSAIGRTGVERYLKNRVIRCLAILATFHYVCFCHLAFSSRFETSAWDAFTDAVHQLFETAQAIASSPETAVCLAAIVTASLLAAGFGKAVSRGDGIAAKMTAWLTRSTQGVPAFIGVYILVLTFIFCLDWTLKLEPPPVVYMRF